MKCLNNRRSIWAYLRDVIAPRSVPPTALPAAVDSQYHPPVVKHRWLSFSSAAGLRERMKRRSVVTPGVIRFQAGHRRYPGAQPPAYAEFLWRIAVSPAAWLPSVPLVLAACAPSDRQPAEYQQHRQYAKHIAGESAGGGCRAVAGKLRRRRCTAAPGGSPPGDQAQAEGQACGVATGIAHAFPYKGLPRQSGGHWLAREKRRRLSGAAALRNKVTAVRICA